MVQQKSPCHLRSLKFGYVKAVMEKREHTTPLIVCSVSTLESKNLMSAVVLTKVSLDMFNICDYAVRKRSLSNSIHAYFTHFVKSFFLNYTSCSDVSFIFIHKLTVSSKTFFRLFILFCRRNKVKPHSVKNSE